MPKSFQDLINEVHSKGICQECGGCVSFCSSADYNIIGFPNPNAPPEYIHKEKCLECGICYCICPQTRYLHEELDSTYKISDRHSMPFGYYQDIFSCQSCDKDFLRVGTDGGVVNTIINFMIEENEIDGAIVSKSEAPFLREATIAYNKNDLIKASGATLNLTPQLTEVQKYCTYTHSIPELNHYKFKKLAVVGTPCQVYTMRGMQNLGVTPSENIELCLGLFCYENFSFDKSQTGKFEKDFNFKFEDIKKINIKEDLIFKISKKGNDIRTIHIPFNYLTDYMRPACNACNDFSNIYADVSFGGLGSPDKYTTVIIRTKRGRELLSRARDLGIIKCLDMDLDKKTKITNLLTQFTLKKNNRYLAHLEKIK